MARLRAVRIPEDGTSYNRYIKDLAKHTAYNDCTLMMKVDGIHILDKRVTLALLLSAKELTMILTVGKFIMHHKISETGKFPFLAVTPIEGGGTAAFFRNYPTA